MTLAEIGAKYNTDKVPHGYCEHYEQRFASKRDYGITFLEIGTWQGASLRMWREFFPNARIVGLDHSPEWTPGPEDKMTVEIGDQCDEAFLRRIMAQYGPFQFIVDDGGHTAKQHLASFAVLWESVLPGGWYCIEDLHSLYNICWTQPDDKTIVDLLYGKARNILIGGDSIEEVDTIGGNWNDGLICIRKRQRPYTPEHTR